MGNGSGEGVKLGWDGGGAGGGFEKGMRRIAHQSPSLHLQTNVSILATFDDFLKYLFIRIFIK